MICHLLSKDISKNETSWMLRSVQRCRLVDLGQFALSNVHQSKSSRLLLFSHGCCRLLFKSANVQSHRSVSADLICNVLEIWSLKRIHGQAFNCTIRNDFPALSHLCCQRKTRHMKIRGDGSLTDIYVSLSEPDTE